MSRVEIPAHILAYPQSYAEWPEVARETFLAWFRSLDEEASIYTDHAGVLEAWRTILGQEGPESLDPAVVREFLNAELTARGGVAIDPKVFTGTLITLQQMREDRDVSFEYPVVLGLALRVIELERENTLLHARTKIAVDTLTGVNG